MNDATDKLQCPHDFVDVLAQVQRVKRGQPNGIVIVGQDPEEILGMILEVGVRCQGCGEPFCFNMKQVQFATDQTMMKIEIAAQSKVKAGQSQVIPIQGTNGMNRATLRRIKAGRA